nr:Golgi apparatus membrane protein TVP23 homolog A isoform X4 [Peromyscus maniculatus bairdii]
MKQALVDDTEDVSLDFGNEEELAFRKAKISCCCGLCSISRICTLPVCCLELGHHSKNLKATSSQCHPLPSVCPRWPLLSAPDGHPLATFFHLFFRVSAIVTYVCCDWFSRSFVGCFVTVLLLLAFDFWSVKVSPSHMAATEAEARIFWLGLIICPVIWIVFFFSTLFSLKLKWLALVIAGISLQAANLYGYILCKMGGEGDIGTVAASFLSQTVFQMASPSDVQKPRIEGLDIHQH